MQGNILKYEKSIKRSQLERGLVDDFKIINREVVQLKYF